MVRWVQITSSGAAILTASLRFGDMEQLEAGRVDLEAVIRVWCDWKALPAPA